MAFRREDRAMRGDCMPEVARSVGWRRAFVDVETNWIASGEFVAIECAPRRASVIVSSPMGPGLEVKGTNENVQYLP